MGLVLQKTSDVGEKKDYKSPFVPALPSGTTSFVALANMGDTENHQWTVKGYSYYINNKRDESFVLPVFEDNSDLNPELLAMAEAGNLPKHWCEYIDDYEEKEGERRDGTTYTYRHYAKWYPKSFIYLPVIYSTDNTNWENGVLLVKNSIFKVLKHKKNWRGLHFHIHRSGSGLNTEYAFEVDEDTPRWDEEALVDHEPINVLEHIAATRDAQRAMVFYKLGVVTPLQENDTPQKGIDFEVTE
jgi:hypothetical protein